MTIFYHILYPNGLGADRWIYNGWKNAFEDLGHQIYPVSNEKEILEKSKLIKPDLLMTSYSLWNFRNFSLIENCKLKIENFKLAMFVDNDAIKLSPLLRSNKWGQVDLYFGERSEEMMSGFEKLTGKKYHLIPNAADKTLHFPTAPVEKYKCDIAYVGAYLPKKKEQFKKLILPLTKKYDVRIYGPYWTWKEWVLLAGNKFSRKIKFYSLANWFNNKRMTLPPEDENKLYSSAKISLNLHERENGRDYDLVNQRTFKIPACGGFEICDNVKSLRNFFTEDELVMAKNGDDWFKKIDYYLTHKEERRAIQEKGTARALRDHTYHNRVKQLLHLLYL